MKKGLFLITIVAITIAACKTSKETAKTETPVAKSILDCSTSGMTYASIKSIFEKNCINCHDSGGPGGYNFENVLDIKRAAKSGDLLGVIKWQKGYPKMPAKADQLDQTAIDQIECWITNGMKE